jgi:hypothetical protein
MLYDKNYVSRFYPSRPEVSSMAAGAERAMEEPAASPVAVFAG